MYSHRLFGPVKQHARVVVGWHGLRFGRCGRERKALSREVQFHPGASELLGLGGDDRDPEGRSRDRDLDDLDDDLDDLDPDIDVDLRSLDEGERQRRRRRRRRRRSENKDKSDAQLAVVAAAVAMATAVGAAFLFLRAFLLNGGGGPGGMGGRAGGKGGSPTGGKVAKEANAFTKRGLRREALVGEGSFGKVRVCGGRGGACIRERA